MSKHFFKRFSPDLDTIRKNKLLACLGSALHQPCLWQFNRRSVATAFAVGFFCMWIPFPPQSLMAAAAAVFCRANLPLSVALIFITNPVTIPPMFYFAYELGALVMGHNRGVTPAFEVSADWLSTTLATIWQPLLLGCSLLAMVSALLGYYGIQLFWRLHVVQRLKERKALRRQRRALKKEKAVASKQASPR